MNDAAAELLFFFFLDAPPVEEWRRMLIGCCEGGLDADGFGMVFLPSDCFILLLYVVTLHTSITSANGHLLGSENMCCDYYRPWSSILSLPQHSGLVGTIFDVLHANILQQSGGYWLYEQVRGYFSVSINVNAS